MPRISEATRLKPEAIDRQRMVLRVEQGKGQKDRYVVLSAKLLKVLADYWRAVRPAGAWTFPGAVTGYRQAPWTPPAARHIGCRNCPSR